MKRIVLIALLLVAGTVCAETFMAVVKGTGEVIETKSDGPFTGRLVTNKQFFIIVTVKDEKEEATLFTEIDKVSKKPKASSIVYPFHDTNGVPVKLIDLAEVSKQEKDNGEITNIAVCITAAGIDVHE